MSKEKEKEMVEVELVDDLKPDAPIVNSDDHTEPPPVPKPSKPSAKETVEAIVAEIAKRDKIIKEREETILELMKDRAGIAARLDETLNQLARATNMSAALGRESYNSILNEYKAYDAHMKAKKEE